MGEYGDNQTVQCKTGIQVALQTQNKHYIIYGKQNIMAFVVYDQHAPPTATRYESALTLVPCQQLCQSRDPAWYLDSMWEGEGGGAESYRCACANCSVVQ